MKRMPVLMAAAAWFACCAATASAAVTVTADADRPGPPIPADYLGISCETGAILGAQRFTPANASLLSLYRTLGVRSLRIGGNQVDMPDVAIPTLAAIDALFGFARAAELKVIYSFRLETAPDGKDPDPAAEAAAARHIATRYGDLLDTIEVGNEPNLYSGPLKLTYAQFFPKWSRLAGAIAQAAPEVRFSGPGTSGQPKSWCPPFGKDAKAQLGDRLAYVCQHQYFGGSAKKMPDVAAGRARLLAPQILVDYQAIHDSFVPACRQMGLGYRLEETNSVSRGGSDHVSNTLASALWAVRYLHWWADHDCLGINFHTGDWKVAKAGDRAGNYYAVYWGTPSGTGYVAQPLAYAMKAFDLGSHGRRLPVTVGTGGGNLAAYAVLGDEGSLHVTLINTGPDAVAVSIPAGGRSNADVCLLTTANHDLADETGITLGGASITDDGHWAGHPEKLPPPAGGAFAATVPPASVAVVTLAP